MVKNDAKVICWILSLVDPQIVRNLRPHKTAKKMWEYMKKIYNQDNSSRWFQLEYKILSIVKELRLNKSMTPDL